MNKNTAVIVQCRISSTRLPGKALKDLGGKPVLAWTLNSMKKVPAARYFVATDEDSYGMLKPVCEECGWEIFKGPLNDVLKRYCLLIEQLDCAYVLRATADNPFLFYEAAEALCVEFEKQNSIAPVDYMTWTGLPHGSGVEIFKAESLLKAEKLTEDPFDREHVGPALYNHKSHFTSLFFKAPKRFYYPDFRTTIDTPQDYRRAISIMNFLSGLKAPEEPYTTEQIVSAVKNPFVNDTVLFVPSVKKGCGTGHLRRCLKAAFETGSFVYIPENPELSETAEVLDEYISNGLKEFQIVRKIPEVREYSLIALDNFKITKEEAVLWHGLGTVLAIDEGSDFTDWCDYLLDIIPSWGLTRKANLTETAFISKTETARTSRPENFKNVLVCFGGEDPAGFTMPVCRLVASDENYVTAIISQAAFNEEESVSLQAEFPNVKFSNPVPDLKDKLSSYDLVITHYGLTAFEAVSAGCGVLLAATSKLHQELAKKYGFACITEKDFNRISIEKILSKPENLFPEKFFSSENKMLGKFVTEISHGKRFNCPVCGITPEVPDEIRGRTDRRTFRQCRKCGITYISFNADPPESYETEYFSDQYKNQYGKTYLEDFENIKNNSFRRIGEISLLLHENKERHTVLDIGCAYGPFLSAASDRNWHVYGVDVSQDAVKYVQEKLLFPAVCASFPDFDPAGEFGMASFDAVTMWYVIEHFSDLKSVLSSVSAIVKKGGIFAFSTPCGTGVSAKYNEEEFYKNSPKDHFTIWTAKTARKIMKQFGFKVVRVVSTGHHPERFPKVRQEKAEKGSFLFELYEKISRAKKLGDTFEVYCRKVTD